MSGFGNTWAPDFQLSGANFGFDGPNVLQKGRRRKTDFEVLVAGLRFSCRYICNPDSDKLLVSLRSTMNDTNVAPVFHRLDYDELLGTNVLAICDPSFYLNRSMRVSCFLGSIDKNPIAYMNSIVKRVAGSEGVRKANITYWGASAAALGAAMAVIHLGAGQAVLINPLLDVRNFRRSCHSAAIFETLGIASYDELFEGYTRRLSVSRALKHARAQGGSPQLLLVQNKHDRRFYRTEYSRFCAQWEVDPAGGRDASGNINTILYDDPVSGHGHETDEVALMIARHQAYLSDGSGGARIERHAVAGTEPAIS